MNSGTVAKTVRRRLGDFRIEASQIGNRIGVVVVGPPAAIADLAEALRTAHFNLVETYANDDRTLYAECSTDGDRSSDFAIEDGDITKPYPGGRPPTPTGESNAAPRTLAPQRGEPLSGLHNRRAFA